jgi:hypothetical protein
MNTKNRKNTMNMTHKSKANTHTRYTPVALVGPIHELNRITRDSRGRIPCERLICFG